MSTQMTIEVEVPPLRKILTATAMALVAAVVILVAFVLPSEYGIDPLHSGRALGLTDLANANEPSSRPPVATAPAKTPEPETTTVLINPVLVPSPAGDAPTMKNVQIQQRERLRFDSRAMTLAPGEGMEIKYDMKKGAGLTYSWSADGTLLYEFHGEPDVKPEGKQGTDYYESYELNDRTGSDRANGTFIAPSTGIHGWFWENRTGKPVTLKLVSAGFYDWIMQNRKNKHTALKPMDAFAIAGHPTVPDEVIQ